MRVAAYYQYASLARLVKMRNGCSKNFTLTLFLLALVRFSFVMRVAVYYQYASLASLVKTRNGGSKNLL